MKLPRNLLATLTLLALFLTSCTAYHFQVSHTLARLQKEIASLSEEIAAKRRSVHVQEAEISEMPEPVDWLWMSQPTRTAKAAFEENILSSAQSSGLELIRFGTLTTGRSEAFPILEFEVEARGHLDAVYGFLASIERAQPRIAISKLFLRKSEAAGQVSEKATVSIQAIFWGLGRNLRDAN